jgi:hypothetical protein
MKPTMAKNFSLYPSDVAIIKSLAKQIKQEQDRSQADSAALRMIIREWAEFKKSTTAVSSPCADSASGN